jgi:hypothetical protein
VPPASSSSGPTEPIAKPSRDRRHVVVAALLAGCLVLGFAGIAGVACSPRAGGPTSDGRAQASRDVEALVVEFSRGQEANYTAEYAATDGTAVTVAQAPPRHSYQNMNITYILTPDDAYLCHPAPSRCQRAPGADELSGSQVKAIADAFAGVFIAPEAAIARLTSLVDEPGVRVGRAQRSVAGGPADCVAVRGPGGPVQTACVNPAGVLVHFDGTSEAGYPVRVELHSFTATVAPESFDPPARAKMTDVTAFN